MKITFIIAEDWANAGWNVWSALYRYGMDVRLINLKPRFNFEAKYDLTFWNNKSKAADRISDTDLYVVFESGGTFNFIKKLGVKTSCPVIGVVNSSKFYHRPEQFESLRPLADFFVALTPNFPIEDITLLSQPVDERTFNLRTSYKIRNKYLTAAAAPFQNSDKAKKGLNIIESRLDNFKYIMGLPQHKVILEYDKYDLFTHGIYYAYGYTLIEAAMMGIPCFGSILDRDKNQLLLDGKYPIYNIGRSAEFVSPMLEYFSDEDNRRSAGTRMREWAIKYHSHKSCYENFNKIIKEKL